MNYLIIKNLGKMKNYQSLAISMVFLAFLITSCSPSEKFTTTATSLPNTETPISTNTPQPTQKPTETPEVLPALTNWKEIPILPDALSGSEGFGDYQYITESPARIITAYYKQEMPKLGWMIRGDMMASTSSDLVFIKENTYVFFLIKAEGDRNIVYIHMAQG